MSSRAVCGEIGVLFVCGRRREVGGGGCDRVRGGETGQASRKWGRLHLCVLTCENNEGKGKLKKMTNGADILERCYENRCIVMH